MGANIRKREAVQKDKPFSLPMYSLPLSIRLSSGCYFFHLPFSARLIKIALYLILQSRCFLKSDLCFIRNCRIKKLTPLEKRNQFAA